MRKIIAECDYAIIPVDEKYKVYVDENYDDGRYFGVKYKYGCTNKFFDPMEAGIPIIASSFDMVGRCLEKQSTLIYSTLQMLDMQFLDLVDNKECYKYSASQNTKNFTMEANIDRLITLYNGVRSNI